MSFCSDCGKPANGTWVDFGIGSYEFHGQKGVDIREAYVSACCEADLVDENGKEIEPPEEQEDDYRE